MFSPLRIIALAFWAVCFLAGSVAAAQIPHFGHIDFQKVLNELPEKLEAERQLNDETQKLRNQLNQMNAELELKYNEYISRRDSLPHLIKVTREKELQDTEGRIRQFKDLAMQSISAKEQSLLEPIVKKLMDVINEVRAELGLLYVFDVSSQVILSMSSESVNLEPHVKAKLGM